MKQFEGIKYDAQIPIYEQSVEVPEVNPMWSVKAGNCKICWCLHKKEIRSKVMRGTCIKMKSINNLVLFLVKFMFLCNSIILCKFIFQT